MGRPPHHNWGCRVEGRWQLDGMRAVVLENELLRVVVLADKGSDIVDFLHKPTDTQFLWRSPLGIVNPFSSQPSVASSEGPFTDFYEGGWQECFPNGGRNCLYKGAEYGLHGEVWGLPWDVEVVRDDVEEVAVRFTVATRRSPFLIEKTLRLSSGQAVLEIEETVHNVGEEEMAFMWGHHPAFGGNFLDEHCVLFAPAARVVNEQTLAPTSRFSPGQEFPWPKGATRNGQQVDVSRILPANARVSDMFYLVDLREGWYALVNQKKKLGFGVTFDLSVFRCLWMWAVYGGEFGYPWYGRAYTVAVEPFSSWPAVLTRAVENGTHLSLAAGESISTRLTAQVLTNVTEVTRLLEPQIKS